MCLNNRHYGHLISPDALQVSRGLVSRRWGGWAGIYIRFHCSKDDSETIHKWVNFLTLSSNSSNAISRSIEKYTYPINLIIFFPFYVFVLQSHEFDECRFDVSIGQNVWYLRAENPEDKRNWIEVLQSYKTDYPETVSLRRHGSTISLQSNTLSTASGSSLKRVSRGLREKMHEIETYRDILYGQIETLQRYGNSIPYPRSFLILLPFQLFWRSSSEEWRQYSARLGGRFAADWFQRRGNNIPRDHCRCHHNFAALFRYYFPEGREL